MTSVMRATSLLLAVGAPAVVGAVLARRSHPQRSASEQLTVAVVWATSLVVVASLVLGAFGLFRLGWLLAVLTVGAVASLLWARGSGPEPRLGRGDVAGPDALLRAVPAGLVGLVSVQWLNSAATAVRHGMVDADSQHYHLTHAARFVQSGEVLPVHRVSAGDLSAFHPNNDELIRAVGLAATRSEASGLVWVAVTAILVVAAAAMLGRYGGRSSAMVAATTVALVLPGGARQYAGSAANDWAAVALLAAAVALWAVARTERELVPAGLAAGLALGTKLTVLAPVGVFFLAAIGLAHPVPRGRRSLVLLSSGAVTGAWWFVRNWIAVGTPVPGLGLPFLDDPAAPLLDEGAFSVLHYATDLGVIREFFLPGLRWSLGPLWWAVLGLVVAGTVIGLRRGRGPVHLPVDLPRMLAVIAAVTTLAYLLTPTGAAGPPGQPVLFQFNVRYLLPAILAAFWILAWKLPARSVIVGAAALVPVTLMPAGSWQDRGPKWLLLALVVAVIAAVAVSFGRRPPLAVSAVVTALAVVVIAVPVTERMTEHRYSEADARSSVLAVGRGLGPDDAVGVVGFPLQYAYTGAAVETRVDYLGVVRDDGAFVDHATCSALVADIEERGLSHVAVLTFRGLPAPPAAEWLDRLDGTSVVAASEAGQVFRIDGAVDPVSCADG